MQVATNMRSAGQDVVDEAVGGAHGYSFGACCVY